MSVVVHVQAPTWPNVLSLHSPLGTACELLTLIRACTMLILLVEDSVSDVFLFRALLKEQGLSPQLVIASDGDLACSMIEQMVSQAAPCPDLIVLDLNLPKKSGFEVLETIRCSPQCAQVPVVIWSTSEFERDRATRLGATSYLKKPFGLDEYLGVGEKLKLLLTAK